MKISKRQLRKFATKKLVVAKKHLLEVRSNIVETKAKIGNLERLIEEEKQKLVEQQTAEQVVEGSNRIVRSPLHD